MRFLLALSLLSLLICSSAAAHKPSDSYLALEAKAGQLHGYWDIALRDLDRAFPIDDNGDGHLTWGELRMHEAKLTQQAFATLTLRRAGQPCTLQVGALQTVEHSDGRYARLPFDALCPAEAGAFSLAYDFFFTLDPQHRAVARVSEGEAERTFVLSTDKRSLSFDLTVSAPAHDSVALIFDGVGHILSGLDHVLFLLALLLPSVLRQQNDELPVRTQIQSVLRDVFKVVTAFTIAHSLTLALAALGLVNMAASVIEPAIAASVVIAALDNLWPVFGRDRWSIAFALGLLHGFGFSSALSDLGLRGAGLLRGLFAFNVGVELGQLAIVALFVPLAFLLRRQWTYRFVIFRGGSVAIAALSLLWFVERVRGG